MRTPRPFNSASFSCVSNFSHLNNHVRTSACSIFPGWFHARAYPCPCQPILNTAPSAGARVGQWAECWDSEGDAISHRNSDMRPRIGINKYKWCIQPSTMQKTWRHCLPNISFPPLNNPNTHTPHPSHYTFLFLEVPVARTQLWEAAPETVTFGIDFSSRHNLGPLC